MACPFSCALCGGSRARRPLFTIDQFRYWRCPDCGLIQMHPLPSTNAAGEDYAGFDLDSYRRFMTAFRIPQYERDLSFIRKYAAGGQLLDVGCGMGEFLTIAEKRGFRTVGLEPSRTAYEIARRSQAVVRGELRTVTFKAGSFDVVTLWSVLEHVPDLADLLERVRASLKTGGILALRVPDAHGLLPSLALLLYRVSLGRIRAPLSVLYQLAWHYKHVYNFDRRTLGRFLEKHGFEVLETRSENSFDRGSLGLRFEYLPMKRLCRRPVQTALGALLGLAVVFGRKDEIVLLARKKKGG
jgi:2-polyprenyl-3-methyl-5-hydroxy-6-metoxy-1,4-benzoquinol methylase